MAEDTEDTTLYCNWCGLHIVGKIQKYKRQMLYHEHCWNSIFESHERRVRTLMEDTYIAGEISFAQNEGIILFYRQRGSHEVVSMSVIHTDFTPLHRIDGLPMAWQPVPVRYVDMDR